MTVKELIDRLKKLNQDLPISIYNQGRYSISILCDSLPCNEYVLYGEYKDILWNNNEDLSMKGKDSLLK